MSASQMRHILSLCGFLFILSFFGCDSGSAPNTPDLSGCEIKNTKGYISCAGFNAPSVETDSIIEVSLDGNVDTETVGISIDEVYKYDLDDGKSPLDGEKNVIIDGEEITFETSATGSSFDLKPTPKQTERIRGAENFYFPTAAYKFDLGEAIQQAKEIHELSQ